MLRKQLRFGHGFRVAGGNRSSQAAQMVLAPDETTGGPDNCHRGSNQWLYVVSGEGQATVDGRRCALRPGTILLIARGEHHEIKNTGRQPLETVNIYVPPAYDDEGNELPAGKC